MQRGQPDEKQNALDRKILTLFYRVRDWKGNGIPINLTTRAIIEATLTKICCEIQKLAHLSQKTAFNLSKTLSLLATINYDAKKHLRDGILEKIINSNDAENEPKPYSYWFASILCHFANMNLTWSNDLLKLQEKILTQMEYFAEDYTSVGILTILSACNKLQIAWQNFPSNLQEKLLFSVERNANHFNTHWLSGILWSCTKLGLMRNDFSEVLQNTMRLGIKRNPSGFAEQDIAIWSMPNKSETTAVDHKHDKPAAMTLLVPCHIQKDTIPQSLSSMSLWVAQSQMEITSAQAINTMKAIKKIAGIDEGVISAPRSRMNLWIVKNCLSDTDDAKTEAHVSPVNANTAKK